MDGNESKGVAVPGPDLPVSGRELTPVFANQSHIITSAEVVRISFGELVPGAENTRYHTAVVMPVSLAKNTAELLLQLLSNQQPQSKNSAG